MRVVHIGSDHAGFDLKERLVTELKSLNMDVINHGTHSKDSCDYPVIAHELCDAVLKDNSLGILICGTGLGMSMAANRHKNIRAALCSVELHARMARRHNDANVLCLGARVTGEELALAITVAFLESGFEGGRHQRRVDQIDSGC